MIARQFVAFLDALTGAGLSLLAGTTVLLLLGCLAIWRHRSPIQRQRLGEMTVASVLIWLGLALAPLPRPFAIEQLLTYWKSAAVENPGTPKEMPPSPQPNEFPRDDRAQPPQHALDVRPIDSIASALTMSTDPVSRIVASGKHVVRENLENVDVRSRPVAAAEIAAATPIAPAAVTTNEARVTPFNERIAALATRPTFRVLAAIYVGGSSLCLAWLGLGTWLLYRVVRTAQMPDDWLRRAFDRLAEPGRLSRTRMLVSSRYPRAMSFGVWQPTIVLPVAVCRPENVEQLRHVLRHELAHIHQRDAWSNFLLNVAFLFLYFHPCFWWLRSRVRISAELVADEWAATQSSHGDYARQLVAFARACHGRALRPAGAAGILDSSTQFARRIEMLIRRQLPLATTNSPKWRFAATSGTVLCLSALAASIGAPVRANSPAAETANAALPDAASPDETSALAPLDRTKVMSFEFRNAPWTQVLSQFAAETHLALRMDAVPNGDFSRSDSARYSPSQTLAILNNNLANAGYQLKVEGKTLRVCAISPNDAPRDVDLQKVVRDQVTVISKAMKDAESATAQVEQQLKALQEMNVEMSKQAASLEAEMSKLKSTGVPSAEQLKALLRFRDEMLKRADAMKAEADKLKSSQHYQEQQRGQSVRENLMLQLREQGDAKRSKNGVRRVVIDENIRDLKVPVKLTGHAVQLRFALPSDVKKAAEALGIDMSVVKIIVDDRTNRILIFGAGEKEGQAIDSIIKFFDQPPAEPKERVADRTPDPLQRSPQKMSPARSEDPTIGASSSAATASESSVDPAQPTIKSEDPFLKRTKRPLASAEAPTDLVSLAVAYSDAVGQVQESRHDPAKLRRAERKLRTLREIVEVLRSAKAEQVKLAESNGVHSDAERDTLIERKANLAALDKILAPDETEKGLEAR